MPVYVGHQTGFWEAPQKALFQRQDEGLLCSHISLSTHLPFLAVAAKGTLSLDTATSTTLGKYHAYRGQGNRSVKITPNPRKQPQATRLLDLIVGWRMAWRLQTVLVPEPTWAPSEVHGPECPRPPAPLAGPEAHFPSERKCFPRPSPF